MPIDKARHPEYTDWIDDWRKCRIVLRGRESEVKGESFRKIALPPLDGHLLHRKGLELYDSYVRRADWFAAAARTFGGLYGALTHKPASLVPSTEELLKRPQVKAFLEDVTGTGVSWESFLASVAGELLRINRGGILIDFTAGEAPTGPAAREAAAGRRPAITWYSAESIEDWDYGDIGGRQALVYLKLCETVSARGADGDPYKRADQKSYRELVLVEGVYTQRVWKEAEKGAKTGKPGEWYIAEERVPKVDGRPLSRIPFRILPKRTAEADIQEPPLLALVTKNLAHLRWSGDHANAMRQAGSPTHWMAGPGVAAKRAQDQDGNPVPVGDEVIVLGAERILTYPDSIATGTLTISAEATSAIEAALDRCDQQLVILGARTLRAEMPAESGVAKQEDTRRDISILTHAAREAAEGLEAAFDFALPWLNAPTTSIKVEPNLDFLVAPLTAAEAQLYYDAHDRRVIAMSDVRRAFRDGERLPLDRTDAAIEEELLLEGPIGPPVEPRVPGPTERRGMPGMQMEEGDHEREMPTKPGGRR